MKKAQRGAEVALASLPIPADPYAGPCDWISKRHHHMELGAATQPGQNQVRFLDKQLQATRQYLGARPCAGFIISVAHRGKNPLETLDAPGVHHPERPESKTRRLAKPQPARRQGMRNSYGSGSR